MSQGSNTGVTVGAQSGALPPVSEILQGPADGVPDPPDTSSPVAGIVSKWGTGSGPKPFTDPMELHFGLYNFDDLKSRGLHDAISSLRVDDGWTVTLFKDVENGRPQGRSVTIEGPDRIPELRDDSRTSGMENETSAIVVTPTVSNSGENGTGNGENGNVPTDPTTGPPTGSTPPIDHAPDLPGPGTPEFPPAPLPEFPSEEPNPPIDSTSQDQRSQAESGLGLSATEATLVAAALVGAAVWVD